MTWISSGRLLLCRHGQTAFNASLRFQGQLDEPLSELGREQARRLGDRLAGERIDVAYTSDLCRAYETATLALAGRPVPLHLDERLREVAFGRWEGLTFAEIKKRFPDDVAARDHDRVNYAMPGGESLIQLADRLRGFLEDVLPRHGGQTILVIAHGGTMNAAISTLLDMPLSSWWRLRNHNANVSMIHFTAHGPRLASFNDTCHLGETAQLRWP
ncbi:MAG TPA: histidine phosphatase family protein [Chloroflexota bacterium]|nr:histidine phosphatase family protein [Chloroflexota bacterium]